MMRLVETIEMGSAALRSYLAMFSAKEPQLLSTRIGELCHELAAVLEASHVSRDVQIRIWACIDRSAAGANEPNSRFSLSSLDVTVEVISKGNRYVYFIATTITILDPENFAWLRPGRSHYQDWVVKHFLWRWRDAVQGLISDRLHLVLSTTHAWAYGNPSRMWSYDQRNEPVNVEYPLPMPEDAFMNGRRFLGVPDEPEDDEFNDE